MRAKLGYGALGVTIAFLLVTNPVIVEAAGQITSGQIKNESIKSKDIKNNQVKGADVKDGSLSAADLAAGTVPAASIRSVKRFLGGGGTIAESTTLSFYGTTTSVTVDGNDLVVASGSLDWYGSTEGDDFRYSLCSRPTGSGAAPAPIGGPLALSADVDVLSGDGSVSRHVSDVLPAGSHDIGMCARADTTNAGTVSSFGSPGGWVMVVDGSGPLAKVGPAAPRKTHSEG